MVSFEKSALRIEKIELCRLLVGFFHFWMFF